MDGDRYIEEIKESIASIMARKFGDPYKREIYEYPDRLNFACPYCGDSTVSKFKKRGNLFLKNMGYHCFNCGKHTTLMGLLRDFGESVSPETAIGVQGIIKERKVVRREREVLDLSVLKKLEGISVSRDDLKKRYRLCEVTRGNRMHEYLKKRCLLHRNVNFLYNMRHDELYVLNLARNGGIAGFQIRSFSDDMSKYRTYNIERILGDLGRPFGYPENDTLNSMSTVFNICTVDLFSPLYVFEGGIDSFFIRNSIGICGVRRDVDVIEDLPNCYYFFDNDADGFRETVKKVREGHYAFMWGRFLRENGVEGKIKDFNDFVIWTRKYRRDFDFKVLKGYFTNDIMDVCDI